MKQEMLLDQNLFFSIKTGEFSLLKVSNIGNCLHIFINEIYQPELVGDFSPNSPLCSECTLFGNEQVNIQLTLDPMLNDKDLALLTLRKKFIITVCTTNYRRPSTNFVPHGLTTA